MAAAGTAGATQPRQSCSATRCSLSCVAAVHAIECCKLARSSCLVRLQVWLELSGYVQKLNTHFGLYSALVAALREQQRAAAAGSVSGWDAEALLVGRMLRRDFERYGVHLSGGERDRMTALVHAANQLGTRFTQNVLDPSKLGQLELPAGAAAGRQRRRRRWRRWRAGDCRWARFACKHKQFSDLLTHVLAAVGVAAISIACSAFHHPRVQPRWQRCLHTLLAASGRWRHVTDAAALRGWPARQTPSCFIRWCGGPGGRACGARPSRRCTVSPPPTWRSWTAWWRYVSLGRYTAVMLGWPTV